MTMLSKIAKAIYESRNGPGCKPWSQITSAHQAPYLMDAVVALRALDGVTCFVWDRPSESFRSQTDGKWRPMLEWADAPEGHE